ncbi:MAG: L,D-transpeptidase family protein, partial [Aestuariivirgaceae bacterium]|nr:L,D-transpeptidase family protein [Aestuariivirgaceae bacterium]
FAATDAPVVIKKNFSAARPDAVSAGPKRNGDGSFFGGLFGTKPKFVIEDVPDGPAVSSSNPEQGFDVYKPEKRLPLADPSLSGASPFVKLSGDVLEVLRDETTPIEVRAAEKAAILGFYANRSFKPAWVSREQGITPQGRAVLAKLATAGEDGLEARDYLPTGLSGFTDDGASLKDNDAALARADVAITAMAARYAHELHSGRIVPKRLSGYYDIDPPKADLEALLNEAALAGDPAAVLAAASPVHPEYAIFKAELARQRELAKFEREPIPDGPRVKPGQKDPRIALLRQRMLAEAFILVPPESWEQETQGNAVLDKTLSDALKALQTKAGLKVTGALDKATVSAINGDSALRNADLLVVNMERLRWLPRDLGPRYIFANQAAYELRVMNNGAEEWRTRVIVGRPTTQTTVFNDEMEVAVINPTWGVPQSIIVKEMLPELRRDPGYLDRQGFQVSDNKGNIIPSSRIDWSQFSNRVPLNVVQPAGGENALGEIKFLFPNSHNIYMHDTPNRKLFEKDQRAFSHGCVRVQDPRRFAEIVLGWDGEKIASAIASRRSQTVPLPEKLPVYLHYFTAWPAADGTIQYHEDIYNRDARLGRAFNTLVQVAAQ